MNLFSMTGIPMLTLLMLGMLSAMPLTARADTPKPTDPATVPFVARTVTTSTGTYGFEVFVPVHWDKKKKWPIILFLHGSGERGTDNQAQTKNGIRLLIAQDLDKFPAVVVCPQSKDDVTWNDDGMQEMALKALDQSVAEFNGDTKREYLTGLSLGGYGTWDLAQKYPDRWAAIAPCCGGIIFPWDKPAPPADGQPTDPYYAAALKVQHIPAWVFHGQADGTVPVSELRQMFATLFAMKADVRYNEYPGVGHNSWDYAYKEPGLTAWFLSHKLK